jgi:hypothetical protein
MASNSSSEDVSGFFSAAFAFDPFAFVDRWHASKWIGSK